MTTKYNDTENKMSLKLIVHNKIDDDKIKILPMLNDQHCEFYLQEKNVTPQQLANIKYFKLEIEQWTRILLEKERQIYQIDENCEDFFLNINVKTIKSLLDDVFGINENVKNYKYDIGLSIPHSRENIITQGYEIELTESKTFSILNLPSSITLKGDGDNERIQEINDIYLNNRMKSHVKINNITQTINSFMDHENEKCQTTITSLRTVGTQVHDFNIIDIQNGIGNEQNTNYAEIGAPLSTKILNYDGVQKHPQKLIIDTDVFFEKALIMERILMQNTLNAKQHNLSKISNITENFLTYCSTLNNNIDKNLTIKCMHWNETQTHLLAVAYSKLIYYNYEDKPTAVAIWSMKNSYTPERSYKFEESTITCIKFSTENPNHLAIGFYSGKILIIDISSRCLNIVFQKSKNMLMELNNILDIFWTVRIETAFPNVNQYECLMACNLNGRIAQYRYLHGLFDEKIILQLSHYDSSIQAENQKTLDVKKNSKSICSTTQFIELDQNKYLVGTKDGIVYVCLYDNLLKYSTKIIAHYGIIKSLEKSPFCRDVYLTTGCDCSIKIWIGEIFIEPVITVYTQKQIEKAIWSRTNSSVIVSIIENCILIWNISVNKDEPISIHKVNSSSKMCTAIEFTMDGKHLCVSDLNGNVIVYNWSDSLVEQFQENNLMYCIAKSIYLQEYLYKVLCKELPEYNEVFSKLKDEKDKPYFS